MSNKRGSRGAERASPATRARSSSTTDPRSRFPRARLGRRTRDDAEDPRVVFVGGVPYDLSANAVSDDFESTAGRSWTAPGAAPQGEGRRAQGVRNGDVRGGEHGSERARRGEDYPGRRRGRADRARRERRRSASDDRSSTTTATSVESGLSEPRRSTRNSSRGTAGTPPRPESASGSESHRARASPREAPASGPGARGGRGGRAARAAPQSSSRDGGRPADGSDALSTDGEQTRERRRGRWRRSSARRSSAEWRTQRNWPAALEPSRERERRLDRVPRRVLDVPRARRVRVRVRDRAARLLRKPRLRTPPAAQIGGGGDNPGTPEGPEGPGPDDVLISGGVFPAVVEAAAPPFASAPSASAAASRSDVGARDFRRGFRPMDTRDHDLVWFFSHWGAVEGARVMHDVHTGVSRQFGFVRFAETRAANAVKRAERRALHGRHERGGWRRVARAVKELGFRRRARRGEPRGPPTCPM